MEYICIHITDDEMELFFKKNLERNVYSLSTLITSSIIVGGVENHTLGSIIKTEALTITSEPLNSLIS